MSDSITFSKEDYAEVSNMAACDVAKMYYLMKAIAMDISIELIKRPVMVFCEGMVRDDYFIEDLY